MDDILSPLFLYGVILTGILIIGIYIILYFIIRKVRQIICKVRQASNPDEVWKLKFFLEGVGIIAAIAAVSFTAIEVRDSASAREVEAIDRNWDVIYTKEATRIRRTKALENLSRLGEPFEKINLSPEAIGIEKGVNLWGAKLKNANLFLANLTSVNLGEANLTSTDLRNANLTDANLGGANLTSAHLGLAKLISANLTDAILEEANFIGAFLGGANLTSATLVRANLTSAYLFKANLTSADLTKANLTVANLSNADFSDATISEETVLDHTWIWKGCLPEGIPKGWETKLKPEYICPLGFSISKHINVSKYSGEEEEQKKLKNELRQLIEKNCKPFNVSGYSSEEEEQEELKDAFGKLIEEECKISR